MLQPDSYSTEERDKADELKQSKHEIQQKYETEYQEALVKEKENVSILRIGRSRTPSG